MMNNMIQDMIDWIEEHLFEGFSLMKLSKQWAILLIIVPLNFIK